MLSISCSFILLRGAYVILFYYVFILFTTYFSLFYYLIIYNIYHSFHFIYHPLNFILWHILFYFILLDILSSTLSYLKFFRTHFEQHVVASFIIIYYSYCYYVVYHFISIIFQFLPHTCLCTCVVDDKLRFISISTSMSILVFQLGIQFGHVLNLFGLAIACPPPLIWQLWGWGEVGAGGGGEGVALQAAQCVLLSVLRNIMTYFITT
jgi:hypothetical protein